MPRKIDREGNIIKTNLTAPIPAPAPAPAVTPAPAPAPLKKVEPIEQQSQEIVPQVVEQLPQDLGPAPEEQLQRQEVPVIYDFVIHCATLSPAGIDMEYVCSNCPFNGKTQCIDTMLLPTASQMQDMARILMMDEGEEDTGDK